MSEKQNFLRNEFTRLLATIDPVLLPLWGKMNAQQMVEHMADSFQIANGKDPKDCVTPPEHIEKMQAFLMSDKPFRENTKNPQMADEPADVRYEDINDSLGELQGEIDDFFDVFEQDKHKIITNPFYGDLDFDKWVLLLYKHSLHHLRQFGVAVV